MNQTEGITEIKSGMDPKNEFEANEDDRFRNSILPNIVIEVGILPFNRFLRKIDVGKIRM